LLKNCGVVFNDDVLLQSGECFRAVVAILTGRKEREVCKTLDVSHSMKLTALLGSAYCGEHGSCLSQQHSCTVAG